MPAQNNYRTYRIMKYLFEHALHFQPHVPVKVSNYEYKRLL